MGIKHLTSFLRNNHPHVFETVNIADYAFKKLAIDTSLYMCHYKAVSGTKWLDSFIRLVARLRSFDVHCVFIYEGVAPVEKTNERGERAALKAKLEQRINDLENACNVYRKTGKVNSTLSRVNTDINNSNNATKKRLLSTSNMMAKQDISETIDIRGVENKLNRMKGHIFNITPEDYALTRKLFDILRVPYYEAPMEAETMCCDLKNRGLVDGVLSDDSDVLAYGAEDFLTKLDTGSGNCVRISHAKVLESMCFSRETFLDFCIMCGTDYNKNIFKIGPESAFKYLREYKSIEGIATGKNIDVIILNHNRVRELFTDLKAHPVSKIPFCGMPDFEALYTFAVENNLWTGKNGLANIKKSFTPCEVIFATEEDVLQIN